MNLRSKKSATKPAKAAKNARAKPATRPKGPEKSVNTPLVPRARKKKSVNYAESSLEVTRTEATDPVKVPIYKQPLKDTPKKRKGDLYEFDSDSEKYKKKRRQKGDEDSSLDEYNKTIAGILRNIKKRAQKRARKRIYTVKKTEKKVQKEKVPVVLLERIPLEKLQKIARPEHETITDDFFNFDVNENLDSPKINILSDVQLQPPCELNLSLASPALFKQGRPDANSTMVNVLTPWRFNEVNIRRNPHFITLKESALPSINQEMVLDHTIVDKFHEIENTPMRKQPESRKTQKSITDYFPNNDDKENVNTTQSSLFDNDQLSPLKNRSTFERVNTVKRRILGERSENVCANNVSNFGFTSIEDEGTEEALPGRNSDQKPFRFSVCENDKKYVRKRKVRIVEKLPSSDDESEESLSDVESRSGEVRLFEDFEPTQEFRELQDDKTITKKKKIDNKKHRKRKDEMTKEEEQEYEKWASAFNSMCEQVEEFPLEIE
ncbi:uncharacterized protein LOC103314302 [Tribolium castaneum]|uniref:Uncharacterized protein n=1 Tax=Tribolium castaneum TaxID=7070 RepID=D6WZB1_TRICA|nr:PREDICTED: uncharacterized protein LOC103314302 [Tribolium castaneum]EFA09735.2 hypothetical protein TcasGA2_TC011868 [Tribolium castaneum]|eukprot:XP_008198172.2 PREDICTED: uncharacterized protein LOC103314302 [Tribolium castaneum]